MGVTTKSQSNQQGMVSFIVTMFLMLIITLIVIGFSQISRREQRQALDRQLSTQAFYAAESGVNDAISALNTGYTGNSGKGDKIQCGVDNAGQFSNPATFGILDPTDTTVKYTCLLINQSKVSDLEYSAISPGRAISAPMQFVDPTGGSNDGAQDVYVSWTNTGTFGAFAGFPQTSAAPGPVLRIAITDLSGANPYSRTNLDNNTFTAFVYPSNTEPSITFSGEGNIAGLNQQGKIYPADCTKSSNTVCEAHFHFGTASNHLFLRAVAIYQSVSGLSIKANNSVPNQLYISGAQAIIDATGKAQDVLRRVQIRAPLNPISDLPSEYTVQSVDGICKQLSVTASGSSDACDYPGSPYYY